METYQLSKLLGSHYYLIFGKTICILMGNLGEYIACFSNEFSTFSHKLVYIDFQVLPSSQVPIIKRQTSSSLDSRYLCIRDSGHFTFDLKSYIPTFHIFGLNISNLNLGKCKTVNIAEVIQNVLTSQNLNIVELRLGTKIPCQGWREQWSHSHR